jgi:putative hydrolase of the HAD superfamily
MPPIRAFIFDLGNVLLRFSHQRMYEQVAVLSRRDVDAVRTLFCRGLGDDYECGRLTAMQLHRELELQLQSPLDRVRLEQAVGDIFELNADMPPLLDELRRRGFPLILLSNTNETHIRWVREHFDILDRLDHCVLSYEVGAMKPDPRIYAAAIAASGFDPGECFYTDDIPEYVEQGRVAGLQAEVFTGAVELRRALAERGIQLA